MERFNLGLIGLLVLVLSGCASSGSKTGSMGSDNGMGAANDNEDAATYGMGMEGNSNLEAMTDDSMSESLETIIYFDFDRSELRAEYDGLINAHAANMNSNTLLTVRLEGHADERGSREYNIGLGERRAQAVDECCFSMAYHQPRLLLLVLAKRDLTPMAVMKIHILKIEG